MTMWSRSSCLVHPQRWCQHVLHHQTALVRKTMRFITRHVVVVRVPFHLNHSCFAVSHWYTGYAQKTLPPQVCGGSVALWRGADYGVMTPVACKTCGETAPLAILSRSRVKLVLGSTNQMLPLLSMSTMSSRSRRRNSSGFWRND